MMDKTAIGVYSLRTSFMAVCLVGGVLLVGSSAAVAQSSVGDVVWPPENYTAYRDLPDLAAKVLEDPAPLVTGTRPITSFELERINNTATRVFLDEEGRPSQEFTQRHQSVRETDEGLLNLRPSDFGRPLVEIGGNDANLQKVLQIFGPPGAFNVTGEDPVEKSFDFAERLGFPPAPVRVDTPGQAFLPYHAKNACVRAPDGVCEGRMRFRYDLDGLTEVQRNAPPFPAADMRDAYGEDHPVVTATNRLIVIFDAQDRIVAAQIWLTLDLDPSTLMDPAEAADLAREFVVERGHEVSPDQPTGANLLFPQRTDRAEPKRALYMWNVPFVDSDRRPGFDERVGRIEQDAQTGDILSFKDLPTVVATEPGQSPPNGGENGEALPGPGVMALLISAVAAALALKSRRHGE